jgi:hypothetical protein
VQRFTLKPPMVVGGPLVDAIRVGFSDTATEPNAGSGRAGAAVRGRCGPSLDPQKE